MSDKPNEQREREEARLIDPADLTPERFRAWLDGIGNREAAFTARDCEMCALGRYVNHLVGWEPILAVANTHVFESEHPEIKVCELPQWAKDFVAKHDYGRKTGDRVSLLACYAALGRVS
jgi:hypothetical protein